MKRVSAFILSFALLLTVALSSVPVSAEAEGVRTKNAVIRTFEADTFSVIRGESDRTVFTARIESEHKLTKSDVSVYDENGNRVTYMRDDGKGGDKTASDGIFTGVAELSSDTNGITEYYAQVGDAVSSTHQVKFRDEITDADFDRAYEIWDRLERYKNELAARKMSAEEISRAAYDYLLAIASEDIASIKVENEKAFSFVLKSGIENYFEHHEDLNTGFDYEKLNETVKDLSYIGESTIGVWSPYYGIDSSFSLNYLDRANAMKETAGFDAVESYYGAEASVNSFKNFDKYGVVMIDSHGADYNGGGYICIPRPGNYDTQDVSDGHIVLSGSTVYLRGTFMQKYCGTLPNTVVYVGICHGMAANNLYQPLLNHGAGFVCGYDDSVTFVFDGEIMDTFCQQLVSENPSTGAQNTAGQAFDAAVAAHGNIDPYSSSAAVFIKRGNDDVVASARVVAVTDITLSNTELTLYTSNTYQMSYSVTPEDANRHSGVWTSDNPDVISITEDGLITVHGEGDATVTLTVTDTAVTPANVLTKTCTVHGAGDMPVSGISVDANAMTLYAGTSATQQVKAHVLPENATNQNLLYESENTEIATVDSSGRVTPVSVGVTYITVTTEDGGFSGIVLVKVVQADLDTALNVQGGTLTFTTSGSAPSVVTENERVAAMTTNTSHDSSSSIVLDAGTLTAGTVIEFDWKVSSEATYDIFTFAVNSNITDEISGIRNWQHATYEITQDGTYTFVWTYVKDYSESEGSDCAWLDNVELSGEGIMHNVRFLDSDGQTVLSEQTVAHGEAATPPEPPTHMGYDFIGWDTDYTRIVGDVDITAVYAESPLPQFTVTFVDWDGTVLKTESVTQGFGAEAPENPTREGYTFTGWDKDFSVITEDITVTALYTANTYTVRFLDWNGDVLNTQSVEYGTGAQAPEAPVREGHTFTGWDKDFSNITADLDVYALYEICTYTVTFVDWDGTVLKTEQVQHGSAATAPEAPTRAGYEFTGWDSEFAVISSDMTVTAQYFMYGDVSADGVVNTADAVIILKLAAGSLKLNEVPNFNAADANTDESVNTADAVAILKYCAGMIAYPSEAE